MTTVVIDNQKEGAFEMVELLRVLGFVTSIETEPENDAIRFKKGKLIKHPSRYDPLALAGAAEDFPLNLSQIRKEWTKMR